MPLARGIFFMYKTQVIFLSFTWQNKTPFSMQYGDVIKRQLNFAFI